MSDDPPLRFTRHPTVHPNLNPRAPLTALLRFSAGEPVETVVRVAEGDSQWATRFDPSQPPELGLPLLGLRPGREHHLRVTIRDAAGNANTAPEPLSYVAPPLPPEAGEFPPLRATVPAPHLVEPGVRLLSVRRSRMADPEYGLGYGLLVALDEAGEVVWTYRADSQISDVERLRNGNLLYLTADFRAVEIDMLGNQIASWYASGRPQGPEPGIPVETQALHHEILELPWGNLVALGTEVRQLPGYYTSETDPNAPRGVANVLGDEICEFARDGRVIWRWSALDHLDPYRIGYQMFTYYWPERGFPGAVDWSHGNGLCYNPQDDSFILSLRTQDALVKIDRGTGDIRWLLGDPTGWAERFQHLLLKPLGEIRWFYHPHAPTLKSALGPRSRLVLFDNGTYRARPFAPPWPVAQTFSRAVEYEIDEAAQTVRQVWVSEKQSLDSALSYAMGDARCLPETGNVLVSYGGCVTPNIPEMTMENARQWPLWSRIREFTHTDPATVVWEATIQDVSALDRLSWAIYGAKHLSSLYP